MVEETKELQLEETIMKALHNVKDPEIHSISIIELGMFEKLERYENQLTIYLLPTFLGCPALDIIKKNVCLELDKVIKNLEIKVQFIFSPPWTSERITDRGREQLKEFGIAPPPKTITDTGEWVVDCPYCNSPYTTLENLFGPTACRSILYCKTCKNPFETMKPVSTNL